MRKVKTAAAMISRTMECFSPLRLLFEPSFLIMRPLVTARTMLVWRFMLCSCSIVKRDLVLTPSGREFLNGKGAFAHYYPSTRFPGKTVSAELLGWQS